MNFTIKIEQDVDGYTDSPRDWDNLGTMACWHGRYELGDEQIRGSNIGCWLSGMLIEHGLERIGRDGYETEQWTDFIDLLENWSDSDSVDKAWDMLHEKIIILPLYIYDHSGITMSTSNWRYPFNDRWDAGQVGFIYISKEDVRNEYGWSRITSQREDRIKQYLRNEVATYDQYLTGDVYGYIIQDDDGNVYDSCWGFYGYEYCEQEAKVALEYVAAENNIDEYERVQ